MRLLMAPCKEVPIAVGSVDSTPLEGDEDHSLRHPTMPLRATVTGRWRRDKLDGHYIIDASEKAEAK